jgi:hypothetical protein
VVLGLGYLYFTNMADSSNLAYGRWVQRMVDIRRPLQETIKLESNVEKFSLRFETPVSVEDFVQTLCTINKNPTSETEAAAGRDLEDFKFSECLPAATLRSVLHHRQDANRVVGIILALPLKVSSAAGPQGKCGERQ